MKFSTLAASALLLGSTAVSAATINFQELADSTYGESIWTELVFDLGNTELTITGWDDDMSDQGAAYAYLDSGGAGLGVCSDLASYRDVSDINVKHDKSVNSTLATQNYCKASTDDNISTGEYLKLVFSKDATIGSLTFNNHNYGFDNAAVVDIFGAATSIGPTGDSFTVNGGWDVVAGTEYLIEFNNTIVYLESINVVPEPSTIALFGFGILGMGMVARRKKKA